VNAIWRPAAAIEALRAIFDGVALKWSGVATECSCMLCSNVICAVSEAFGLQKRPAWRVATLCL